MSKTDSTPIGRAKVKFVKWLMSEKKISLREAKLICYRKFYHGIPEELKWLAKKNDKKNSRRTIQQG